MSTLELIGVLAIALSVWSVFMLYRVWRAW